jgi:hypothetical protein
VQSKQDFESKKQAKCQASTGLGAERGKDQVCYCIEKPFTEALPNDGQYRSPELIFSTSKQGGWTSADQ